MGKFLRYILSSLFLIVALQLTSSCASRGFKLSQQMPGMDNKLNPIFAESGPNQQSDRYVVAADGSVILKSSEDLRQESAEIKRDVASLEESDQAIQLNGLLYESPGSQVVNSTLDPENGSLLLGEGK